MPENLRAFTLCWMDFSAACCAALNCESNRLGRAFSTDTVNSAGSSIISTSPRFTSVFKVVRGTSKRLQRIDRRLASGGGQSVNQRLLIGVQLAFDTL